MHLPRTLMLAALACAALAVLPAAQAETPLPAATADCKVIYDFPDEGLTLCYDLTSSQCKVWTVHETFFGPQTTCIVGAGESSSSSAGLQCYDVYSRTDVGTYSIVRRNSCAPPEVYQCPYEHAPISSCQSLLEATAAPSAVAPASSPPDPLQRRCVHQGQGELQSEDCVDPTSTDCTLYEQRSTGVSYEWWCYPSLQHGGSE